MVASICHGTLKRMTSYFEIIDFLNEALAAELTAMNQYFLHAKMCEEWGYKHLASLYRAESMEEMSHAEELIDRILLLEGTPELQKLNRVEVGRDIEEQIELNLQLEQEAVDRYRRGILLCLEKNDPGTRNLLERFFVDEEKHCSWYKTQQSLIQDIGIQCYQQLMIGKVED
ncbi:MAG: bacterioferritin [Acidimicrobiaceae bacterium]|nr:bacterioferritin [Acidimicrobiaceae bacterium]